MPVFSSGLILIMKLKSVECHSGYKANQRPLRFATEYRKYTVKEVIDQWHGEDYTYFRVRADDNNIYILKYESGNDQWSMVSYRAEYRE